jgi:transcriptional regulator with XRE-family HTH domain
MPDHVDFERLSSEWLCALRGHRSQRAFSRRLKYRSNVAYLWESGRNWPTAATAFWAAERVGVDTRAAVGRFFRSPPSWLETVDLTDPAGVVTLLAELRAETPVVEIAARIGRNRQAVARWLKGQTQPRLPDFFRLIDGISLRLIDFVALFVDPTLLPCAAERWRQLEAAKLMSREQPWAPAVLLALELDDYRRSEQHRSGWIAHRLGITVELEQECLRRLLNAGQIRRTSSGRWEVVESQIVETRRTSTPKAWWARAASG